jgi:hypothetical protein
MQSELRDRAQVLVDAGDHDAAELAVQALFKIDTHDSVAAELTSRLTAARDRTPASTLLR